MRGASRKTHHKTCAKCGKDYLGTADSKYCSAACRRRADIARKPWRALYNTAKWRELRAEVLNDNDYCCDECGARATVADHRKPHKGDKTLFYDKSNLQALCYSCHNRKSAKE